ncbi:blue light sensor protein [Rhodobacter sphaeroides]|uniref:BLUF domain-containing protein n=1 Tax=Cereibacter sphaeroides TaxID=1063 RepID=UPI00132C3937|nr:BLUF domain-containing protein [Cereibacter sphaeroides]MWP37257.1 blue light sensor protein [Cereibacter sphaeroides]
MDELVSLTYRSRVRLADPVADIVQIMRASRVRNLRLGITGILLYNGVHFVQTIEGPRSACDELFRLISADPRHQEILAFDLEPITARRFPDWSMRIVSRKELRALAPDLERLDLSGPEDVAQLHRTIAARLSKGDADASG